MAGIACGEVSDVAWKLLRELADHAVAIDDELARDTLNLTAKLQPEIEIGETGIAGLAAISGVCTGVGLRSKLGIDDDGVVLAFATEGIIDRDSVHCFVQGGD